MFKLSPRRNQRSSGFKVKHALQICVFGGACVWLIYQFQDKKVPLSYHHQEKTSSSLRRSKATTAAGDQNGLSVIKLGRKDLDPRGIEQMTAEDLKNGGQDAEEDKRFDDETKILEEIKVDDDDLSNGNGDEEPARNPEILDKKLVSSSGSGSTRSEIRQENKKKITEKAASLEGGKGNVTVGTIIESKADKNSTQTESVESKGEKNSTRTESMESTSDELQKTSSNSTSSAGENENPVLNEQRSDTGESLKDEISSSSGGVESAGLGEKINPSNDNDDTTDPSGENRAGEISATQNESGSLSTSVLQEEADARTDLETMPQTETSGNALQATE